MSPMPPPMSPMSVRCLLVGLGNPGARHKASRHNLGFMAVDAIAAHYAFAPWRRRFASLTARGQIEGHDCLALKPQTFMNASGRAVSAACRFHKLDGANVYVFHDEIDLAAERVKVKRGGGAAGHRGLTDIDAACGSDYHRVRLGIGHPRDASLQAVAVDAHVLGNFARSDAPWLSSLLAALCEHLPLLLDDAAQAFMSKVAARKGV